MRQLPKSAFQLGLLILLATSNATAGAAAAADAFAKATEDDRAITIDTDKLSAVIPKNHPKHWMTGIEKGSFVDKASGFHEIGDVPFLLVHMVDVAAPDRRFAVPAHVERRHPKPGLG